MIRLGDILLSSALRPGRSRCPGSSSGLGLGRCKEGEGSCQDSGEECGTHVSV